MLAFHKIMAYIIISFFIFTAIGGLLSHLLAVVRARKARQKEP